SIKTDQDKETIMIGFQKFLNSIDFPIQFVITTHNLNMDVYLEKLKENSSNKELYDDFSNFMNDTIEKNQMRNRLFFLVIPKTSNLKIQTDVCKERLESLGLKAQRITNPEIISNLKLFFNDINDVREEQQETKDKGNNEVDYLIAPNNIKDNVDHLEINKKLCRVITAHGYPRIVQSGFLDKIISSNDDFDISIHIEPFSIESMMIMLNKELQKQRADLYSEELKRSLNPSLEIKYNDTRKVLEEMQKGNEKLFNVSLYINCKGKNKDELDFLTKKVESELQSIMIVPNNPIFRQVSAYKSMIPVANDELKETRNITTKALSAFFPFTSPFLTLDPKGVMLGLNKNKVPYIKDIFSLSNANGVILATSGSGKSYFTKLLIARQLLNNTKVIVIDPQSEYLGLTEQVKGELITISRTSKTILNPLDLMGHSYIEKRLALMDIFKIMFGELTEIQKSILDKAITETYKRKKIDATSYLDKEPPILKDLYKELIAMDKKASSQEKVTYRALINRLYMYTEGVFSFMNRQSKIDFKKDFVCFNIGEMPKQVKPVVMFLILDYVYMKMKQSKERKLLVVDEAWSLLGHTEEAGYIFEIVKTCRKFNLGLLLITQDVADLINSRAGHAVLANSSYSFLLRQKPAIIDSVVKTFNLSQMEKEYLLTATQGKGVLILDNEHQELEVVASPKEHEIITTNPNEVPKEKEYVKNEVEKKEYTELMYYSNKLTDDEKNDLLNEGFECGDFVPIGKTRQESVLIKKNNIEGLDHTFLVLNIKEVLTKLKAKNIEVSITRGADITFTNKKEDLIAIEVETGKNYTHNKPKFLKKFQDLKKEYKHLYVVLTTSYFKRQYENNIEGTPIVVRTDLEQLLFDLVVGDYKRKRVGSERASKSSV
ncbi:MAG: VirB4 family type IV secretion system protein, partial [Candidatus Woesearchaeota archaeon]